MPDTGILAIPEKPLDMQPPREGVLEHEKTPDWFVHNIRHYSQFYNQSINSFEAEPTALNPDSSANSAQKSGGSPPTRRMSDEMRANFSYYFGRQQNVDFFFLTEDASGNSFQNPWIRGKHAAKLVDFMKGPALKLLGSLKFKAVSLSRNTQSKKGELFDKIRLKFEMGEKMKEMEAMGASFNPTDQQFDISEEIDDYQDDYRDEGEDLAVNIATDVYTSNDARYKYVNAWLHVINSGICGVLNYMENGRAKKKHIPSYNLIPDLRQDDDFNSYGRFAGYIDWLTPGEIFSRWNVQDKEMQLQIEALARNDHGATAFMDYYNKGFDNFRWHTRDGETMLIACVTMYWIGPRDLRYVNARNSFNESRIRKLNEANPKERERAGDYITMDVHKGTLIGNKWLADWGYNKNTVREFRNKGNPRLPITIYTPNLTMGEVRATMGMLRNNQDEIDRLRHKIRELTGKDLGKVYVFRGNKMGGVRSTTLMDNFKNVGLHVVAETGEIDDGTSRLPMAEIVDMSNNGYVMEYVKLCQEEERVMEEILNLSKIALGQQQSYISQGAQQNSANYSSMGTAYLYDGFMKFIERDTQYSTNMQKFVLDPSDEYHTFLAGDKGVRWAKMTKGRQFEDILIYVQMQDAVDEQSRQRILAYAQAWSQNPEFGVGPDDILMLESEQTYSSMIRKLRYSIKRKQMQNQKSQAQQEMLSMIKDQQNQNGQMQQEQMRQEGANQRTGVQVQAKVMGDAMKHGQAQEQAAPAA